MLEFVILLLYIVKKFYIKKVNCTGARHHKPVYFFPSFAAFSSLFFLFASRSA
jgi:hypothetical protein